MTNPFLVLNVAAIAGLWSAAPVAAQPLGTFTWRMSPYCNVLVVTVTLDGAGYRLTGYDDECDAARRAPLTGGAVFNPDGSAGFGAMILSATSPTIMTALLNVTTLSGSWTDLDGHSGTLVFGVTGPQPGPRRPGMSSDRLPPESGEDVQDDDYAGGPAERSPPSL